MCYVPPSVELLGPTTPLVFKPGSMTPRFQTILMPLLRGTTEMFSCNTTAVVTHDVLDLTMFD